MKLITFAAQQPIMEVMKMGLLLTNTALTFKRKFNAFMKGERGETNIIAIILIILVVIALVAIFRDRLIALVGTLFDKIGTKSDTV